MLFPKISLEKYCFTNRKKKGVGGNLYFWKALALFCFIMNIGNLAGISNFFICLMRKLSILNIENGLNYIQKIILWSHTLSTC